MDGTEFRDASIDDAERILEIYRHYVEHTAITFEWTVPSLEAFKERMRCTMETYPYIVATQNGHIEGFAYAGPFVGREAYGWSAETTIYLDPHERHRGVGTKLYSTLEAILISMNVLNLNACIGYPKAIDEYLTDYSVRFHEHLGYRMVGRFHDCGYKFGRWYDMVWMEKMIGKHSPYPNPFIPYGEIKKNSTV